MQRCREPVACSALPMLHRQLIVETTHVESGLLMNNFVRQRNRNPDRYRFGKIRLLLVVVVVTRA